MESSLTFVDMRSSISAPKPVGKLSSTAPPNVVVEGTNEPPRMPPLEVDDPGLMTDRGYDTEDVVDTVVVVGGVVVDVVVDVVVVGTAVVVISAAVVDCVVVVFFEVW